MATNDDKELPTYDHTKLSAYNTCPTYGIIRYAHHKMFATTSRALALEMGTVMHEVFAYVRLETLCLQLASSGRSADFIDIVRDTNGKRLLGPDRWSDINTASPRGEDPTTRLKHDVVNVIETSTYYDDDRDKRRTLSNMEEAALAYVDRWDFKPKVWMRDDTDPHSDVGIEIPFDIVVELPTHAFRFTGKLDGLRWRGDKLVVEDNKTASRLNDAWEQSFHTSHQLTGYCLAASVFTHRMVSDAEAIGLAIPLPRSEFSGFMRAQVTRSQEQVQRFVAWMVHTVGQFQEHACDPLNAPMYTHSCNRYFRPCAFIPLCASDVEDRKAMFNEMIVEEWSPLNPVTDGE